MAKGSKTTLNELMGAKGDQFSKEGIALSDLPDLLGEGMPKVEFHALGRVRLIRALRNRFGDDYRNVPGISQLLGEFDKHSKMELEAFKLGKRWGKK